ncbi:MAM domain-containing protein 2a isoform X2 [Scleropages formosus]|uniref:MAM domain containing 2a n=1 Tax=Scleropages formosus TaxID=113540 RepID=A0A8C9VRT2_SCLFO|nr:MAM domain-containing protein 2 isoform X2 [Scleropages formosus]
MKQWTGSTRSAEERCSPAVTHNCAGRPKLRYRPPVSPSSESLLRSLELPVSALSLPHSRAPQMSAFCLLALLALPTAWAQQLLPGSCNFEHNTCGYSSDPAYARWTINEEGRFITVDTSFMDGQEKAFLLSPELDLVDWSCLRLVYQITGTGSLQVHLRPEDESFDYTLWTASKPSDSWLIGSVDLRNASNSYKILIEGRPSKEAGSSVAIFEIHVVPGYCIECNFEEHHLCGYSNHWNPNVNWYVGGSIARDPRSNLPDDHTLSNEGGHYMYADSVYAKKFQEVAKLSSPMTTTPMEGCLSFYYQRDQARGNIFSVFTKDQLGHYEEIWRPEAYAASTWRLVQVDIKAPHPLEVTFEAAFNSPRGGYVALDDISFSPEFCHTETEPMFDPSTASCDFEDGFCQYYQERAEGSVWNRVSVKPNAYRLGDHTTGSGSFLLANTRFTSRPGYVGRLHGPFMPGNLKYCLRFYYALHGFVKIDNALSVYIYDENNIAQEKIWTVSASAKDIWFEVDITFQKPMPTKVVFVSICKNFWDCGLVALDDITVALGDCRIAAGLQQSLTRQCSFEVDDCGYTQDRESDASDWVRMRGHTPTSYTGPRGDHTTGVGYFMYIEASHMLPGHSARLLSTELRGSTGPQCLVFFYHMHGSGTGLLNVFLRRVDREYDALLWRRRGEHSISWMKGMVEYTCKTRHQILFEAIRGPSIRSDIAIDDIIFKKGPCKNTGAVDNIPYSGFSENLNEVEY